MKIPEIVSYELTRLLGKDYSTIIGNEDTEFATKKATTQFLNYTNQRVVPKSANYLIGDMVIALLKINFSNLFDEVEESESNILAKLGSINVGDASLSFGTSKLTPLEIIDKENAMFYTFKEQMKPFRKMPVPGRY